MDIDKELEDLFDDPLLDLSEQEAGLFDFPEEMKRVMATKRVQPDYYAQKKPCEDFEHYRGMFQQVQKELKEGKRSLIRSTKTSSIDAGFFYVVNGILVYLAEVKDTKKNRNGMVDGRTRCIYENGTESDILLQTLRKNVVGSGYAVTELQSESDSKFFTNNKYSLDEFQKVVALCQESPFYLVIVTHQAGSIIDSSDAQPTANVSSSDDHSSSQWR